MTIITCSICRKRPATVLRTISGEYICELCLEKVLKKNVRRTLASSGKLKAGMTVLVFLSTLTPTPNTVAAHIVASVESRYNTRLILAVPECLKHTITQKLEKRYHTITYYPCNLNTEPLSNCISEDLDIAMNLSKDLDADAIVTSYPRILLVKTGLHALLTKQKSLLKISKPYLDTNPPIIHSLSRLEIELVNMYAYLKGFHETQMYRKCQDHGLTRLIFNVLYESRDIEFNALESLSILADKAE